MGDWAERVMEERIAITDSNFLKVGRPLVSSFLKMTLKDIWNKMINKYRKRLTLCKYSNGSPTINDTTQLIPLSFIGYLT